MALQHHVRKPDAEHWINWSDFLLFMSEEVQKPKPNINGLVTKKLLIIQ